MDPRLGPHQARIPRSRFILGSLYSELAVSQVEPHGTVPARFDRGKPLSFSTWETIVSQDGYSYRQ